jgi:16S rRNA (guanine1207-N2)-methyltransferase
MNLPEYHRLQRLPGGLYGKVGARGFEPIYAWLAQHLEPHGQRALDLLGGLGQAGQRLQRLGLEVDWLETSHASLRCLQASWGSDRVRAGLPWELPQASYDLISLALPAERGNRYVDFCLRGAACALRPGGQLWLAGDRQRGFERYLRWAEQWVGPATNILRQGSLRLARLTATLPAPPPAQPWETWTEGNQIWNALPGVFSAGHADPGSQALAAELPNLAGQQVLDLGAGYGWLSRVALQHQAAQVLGLEDDLVSCLSGQANGLEVLHSDVDQALPPERRYDTIISNPPFHLGGSVVLEVAKAFVCAAQVRLARGGRFFLVANTFLPYEPLLANLFNEVHRLDRGAYKVLIARRS